MSELDIEIRYGLIKPEVTEKFPQGKDVKNVCVRLFEEDEDPQWCTGILVRRFRGLSKPVNVARYPGAMEKLNKRVEEGRSKGEIPFRAAGPSREITTFLKHSEIAIIDLVQ